MKELEVNATQQGQIGGGSRVFKSNAILSLGGVPAPVIAVFHSRPVCADHLDPLFGHARLGRLTGEVVAVITRFLATFKLGAFTDDAHEGLAVGEARGHRLGLPQDHGTFFEASVSAVVLGKRGAPPV